jgi:hypothetical protein
LLITDSQRRVERAILVYALMFVALLTLSPMDFTWPDHWYVVWCVPVGYLFVLARDPGKTRPVAAAALFGLIASASIETTQQFVPLRVTSFTDVLANGSGATLGAWLCTLVRAQLERLFPDLLTIEHPLLNVVYLALPPMGLLSIDEHGHSPRTWMLLPLGLMGVITISGLWRYRLAGRKPGSPLTVVLAVLAWFLSGASLALLKAPGIVAICTLAVLGSCLALLARDPRWVGKRRTFRAPGAGAAVALLSRLPGDAGVVAAGSRLQSLPRGLAVSADPLQSPPGGAGGRAGRGADAVRLPGGRNPGPCGAATAMDLSRLRAGRRGLRTGAGSGGMACW